ncbi:peptidoglycan-binding protein [Micromonospora narathiwatensis]|uniref:Putative peptidoglycan binding domain-containing protein n=1 Tax=Micromonospora narathiwatensis TaxID=299146 RepID=A0A1A8Z5V2_9ACTN|nr:peptidoglycan-binding protein [Micromonospora narathiwatensis]SBT39163.1 Putative peptidoglycan binding domain-containing protein [Micromonospora narathiwatensis]
MPTLLRRLAIWLGALALAVAAALTGPTAAQAAAPAWPLLSNGSTGANVTTAQYLLRHRGYSLTVDGQYGAGTTSVVKSFQSANGLSADGQIGPQTWGKLVVTLSAGANNDAVRGLQTSLNKYGYGLAVDGDWGPATTNAVNNFKSARGLSGGSVDATTWQYLTGGSGGGTGNYRLIIGKSVLPRSEYDDPHHDYPAIDLPTVTGTTTYAITSGTIGHVGGNCGLGIGITGDDGAYYLYCHLNSRSVAAGSRVSAGQVLGYTGATGNVTGPHLHLEVRVNGANRCPQNMLLAIYDGVTPPAPSALPATGCTY